MVVNKFKMRSDIRSINIAGMGCSASVIAIDIAKDMLAVRAPHISVSSICVVASPCLFFLLIYLVTLNSFLGFSFGCASTLRCHPLPDMGTNLITHCGNFCTILIQGNVLLICAAIP